MSTLPIWVYSSPSPMTLFYWSLLAAYGANKLHSNSLRSWIANFCESAFVIGIVILPHDSCWQILQWFKYGFLYPEEYVMVINVLIRNTLIFMLCLLSSWKLSLKTKSLSLKYSFFVCIPIAVLIVKFMILNDPVWTDWTYGIRFEENSPWFLAYLAGLPDKVTLALVYVALWKDNFVVSSRSHYSSVK